MARPTPLESDDDSLYARPNPAGQQTKNSGAGRAVSESSSTSLSPSFSSDKENRGTSRASRDKEASTPIQLPRRGAENIDHTNKRRRMESLSVREPSRTPGVEFEELKFYNPDQPVEERREIRKGLRDLNRQINDSGQEWLNPDSTGIKDALNKANSIFAKVRQTSDAVYDSRAIVSLADLNQKQSRLLANGGAASGIDIDEFVSLCGRYMRRASRENGRRLSWAEMEGENDEDLDFNDCDWAHFGSKVAFPQNRRPATPGFLLGPLSVQKRARQKPVRRIQNSQRNIEATQPKELQADDIDKNENSNLTELCKKIDTRLRKAQAQGLRTVSETISSTPQKMTAREKRKLREDHGLAKDDGLNLFRFVIHPTSFSQTVENLFYVSFLIRDGYVEIKDDSEGLPSLHPKNPRGTGASSSTQQRDSNVQRQQAVFNLTYQKWKELVEVFGIEKPMVPDRAPDPSQLAAIQEGRWPA